MHAVIKGTWQYHEEFGQQVAGHIINLTLPAVEPDFKRYLASGAIPGIGGVLAGRLVRRFGTDALRVAGIQPELLAGVKGMTRGAIEALQAAIRDVSGPSEAEMP